MVLNKIFPMDNSVKKMTNEKLSLKKSLVCTLFIALAFTAMATSIASARETSPPQTPPDNNEVTSNDNPILIAPQDNATTGSNDTPLLDRAQDNNVTTPNNDASLISIQDAQIEDNPPLIAPLAKPDNTATILGVTALFAAIAAFAIVVVLRIRKKI
jgi:hypothetical protein